MDDFKCDFCGIEQDTLYEGWFRTPEYNNPWAKGTVSAGLLQFRRGCKECTSKAIENNMACAKELPSDVS